jgi:hypothetical protein
LPAIAHDPSMLWLDRFKRADSLPAAWLIATGHAPVTRPERSALRHATSRAVLAIQLGASPDKIELGNDARGRLLAVGPGGEVLHLSHATRDGMVLVAMGLRRIGADIERCGAGDIPFSALHRAEQLWLHQLPESGRNRAFAQMWAVKEAHGKWAGTGLPETDRHAALPGPDGRWQVAGSAHVAFATGMVERAGAGYALAVAGV